MSSEHHHDRVELTDRVIDLIETGANGFLVTQNPDRSPHVTMIWPAIDNGDIVTAHLRHHQKLRNIERDPRVALAIEGTGTDQIGLREHLVIHGTARVVEGGAPALLERITPRYLPPGTAFPPAGAPEGWTIRITPHRITGNGPWTT